MCIFGLRPHKSANQMQAWQMRKAPKGRCPPAFRAEFLLIDSQVPNSITKPESSHAQAHAFRNSRRDHY